MEKVKMFTTDANPCAKRPLEQEINEWFEKKFKSGQFKIVRVLQSEGRDFFTMSIFYRED